MKRTSFVWAATACVVAPLCLFWRLYASASDPDDSFPHWTPDTETIRRELNRRIPAKPDGSHEEAQRELFAELFKNRYRRNQTQIAVGMRFQPGNRIKLMCPARMEPWQLDRLAMMAWRESRALFGDTFTLDIYETYIGATPRLVGKLRPMPDDPRIARITYDYTTKQTGTRHRAHRDGMFQPSVPPPKGQGLSVVRGRSLSPEP
jgi:hypothetical protein